MDFGEFISAFGKGYTTLIDHVTNKPLTKPYFCRELLCNITKNENIVLYIDCIPDKAHARGESAFYAFYRNSQRRSLHPIAEGIINSDSLDTDKFKTFLAEYVKHYRKEKLLENFKRHLTDISSETFFDDITNEFVRILREEAAKEDRRQRKPKSADKQHGSESAIKPIKKRHAEEIDGIIMRITSLIRNMICYYEDEIQSDTFQAKYKEYYDLNADLCGYGIMYPFVEELQNLPNYSLKELDFYWLDESAPYLTKYREYMSKLINIHKEVSALEES